MGDYSALLTGFEHESPILVLLNNMSYYFNKINLVEGLFKSILTSEVVSGSNSNRIILHLSLKRCHQTRSC